MKPTHAEVTKMVQSLSVKAEPYHIRAALLMILELIKPEEEI